MLSVFYHVLGAFFNACGEICGLEPYQRRTPGQATTEGSNEAALVTHDGAKAAVDGDAHFRQGGFVALDGPVTAFGAGDVNRRDGIDDLVIATTGPAGSELEVFEFPGGAFNADPERRWSNSRPGRLTLAWVREILDRPSTLRHRKEPPPWSQNAPSASIEPASRKKRPSTVWSRHFTTRSGVYGRSASSSATASGGSSLTMSSTHTLTAVDLSRALLV